MDKYPKTSYTMLMKSATFSWWVKFLATALFLCASATINAATLPVFPGAKGFGTATAAGRNGQVIKVTNLNDSGTGSLRAAVTASGARIVVFEISGRINLQSNLTLNNPYITIAGQTAPAPGIMLAGRTFIIQSHDVLIKRAVA